MTDLPHVSEHLANERTYLAWLRTSFSLLALGFATNRFGQFLVELRAKSDQEILSGVFVGSRRFGLGMVILGTVMMAFATLNYHWTRKKIDTGNFQPGSALIWIVGVLSICFGVSAIILLLQA